MLREELKRIDLASLEALRQRCVRILFERKLVQGKVYAVDGSGLAAGIRVVGLLNLHPDCPLWVNWRVQTGAASEKGEEACVVLGMVDEMRVLAGADIIAWLLMDALYADGPLLARPKFERGIDALVRLPEDRRRYDQLLSLLRITPKAWKRHLDTRYVAGCKETRQMAVAAMTDLKKHATTAPQARSSSPAARAACSICGRLRPRSLMRSAAMAVCPLASPTSWALTHDLPPGD